MIKYFVDNKKVSKKDLIYIGIEAILKLGFARSYTVYNIIDFYDWVEDKKSELPLYISNLEFSKKEE